MILRLIHQVIVDDRVLPAGAVADFPPGAAAWLLAAGSAEVVEPARSAVAPPGPGRRTAARRVEKGGRP